MESFRGSACLFVKGYCIVYRKAADNKKWEVFFAVAGHRDRIVEQLSNLSGLMVKDDFSDVACRRGISNLVIFCVARWPLSR